MRTKLLTFAVKREESRAYLKEAGPRLCSSLEEEPDPNTVQTNYLYLIISRGEIKNSIIREFWLSGSQETTRII